MDKNGSGTRRGDEIPKGGLLEREFSDGALILRRFISFSCRRTTLGY